jgi:hypothetical protein
VFDGVVVGCGVTVGVRVFEGVIVMVGVTVGVMVGVTVGDAITWNIFSITTG